MENSTQTHEKRRAPRIPVSDPTQSLFSAYLFTKNVPEQITGELFDYSENGLGIRITSATNLPKVGDNLHGLLYQLDKETSSELGKIQYIKSVIDDSGKKQIRAGIEIPSINATSTQTKATELLSRPHRYKVNPDCIDQTEVTFFIDDEKVKGNLLNFSQKGLAIRLKKEAPLKLLEGTLLKESSVQIKGKELFGGDLVIRNIRENQKEIVIGCEAERNLIDIGRIQRSIDSFLFVRESEKKLGEVDEAKKIPPAFKVVVTDLRDYLEQVREITIIDDKSDEFPEEVIRELYPLFKAQMDEIYNRFIPCVKDLSPSEHEDYKRYFQKHLNPLIFTSPFVKHCHQKPYGYSGDYEMVIKVLDKEIEGVTALGKLLNLYAWHTGAAVAHRHRIAYLIEKLEEVFKTQAKPKILSVGCGPAREVKIFLEKFAAKKQSSFTLVDFDLRALTHCQEELLRSAAIHQPKTEFHFINKSVRQIIKTNYCGLEQEQFDLVYCAGLFDYLSDSFCKRLIEIMSSQLKDGGMAIFTNVTELNYYRYYMEFMGEWYLTHRSGGVMLNLAASIEEDDMALAVGSDSTGVNVFLNVNKTAVTQTQRKWGIKESV